MKNRKTDKSCQKTQKNTETWKKNTRKDKKDRDNVRIRIRQTDGKKKD